MKKFFQFLILLLCYLQVAAQTTGDYQSAACGDLSDASTWQRHNGTSFIATIVAPSTSDVVIRSNMPRYPIISINTTVKSITVATGGTVNVAEGINVIIKSK